MAISSVLRAHRPLGREEERLLERLRARVLAAWPGQIERIVLFGSRARGEPQDGSDWDVAVYLDHEPTERDRGLLRAIDADLRARFDVEAQILLFAGEFWLATSELACNIREDAVVVHGPAEVPMIERPVLQHARDALAKAERFAEQAAQAVPAAYETVVHNSYYAMFHAARAALLATEGSASTNHGRAIEAFARMVGRRRLGAAAADLAQTLTEAHKLRGAADYDTVDLTEEGRQLRERVAPFLALCRELVAAAARPGDPESGG